jgi:3'-5' exoribonuclease
MELLPISELKSLAPANPGTYRIHAQVEKAQSKMAKSGKPYMELSFADAESTITLRAWDDTAAFKVTSVMKGSEWVEVSGHWYDNGGFGLDARDWSLRPLNQEEIDAVIGGSPELAKKQAEDYALIEAEVAAIKDPRLLAVCDAFLDQFGERFKRAGAARFNHHARRGGLVEHVAQMTRTAVQICAAYPQLNRDLMGELLQPERFHHAVHRPRRAAGTH